MGNIFGTNVGRTNLITNGSIVKLIFFLWNPTFAHFARYILK